MTVRGTIIYQGKTPRGIRKAFTNILKEENRESIFGWWQKFMKGHFVRSAESKYNYAPRSAAYNRRKQKLKGHKKPFQFTGKLRRSFLRQIRITGTSKGAKGKLIKPLSTKGKSISRYPKPEFDDELTAINQPEVNFLAKDFHKRMTIKLNKVKENRKITV